MHFFWKKFGGFKNSPYLCSAKRKNNGSLAQLNRASDYGSEGYRFESCRSHHSGEIDCQTVNLVSAYHQFFRKPMDRDTYYMRLALKEAEEALAADEVPIGAVIVSPRGSVIGRGHNLTEALTDVSAHAEMQAITAAAQTLGGKYLRDCTLYVTVEPCLMCAGAIGWAQVGRIVYGAPDSKRGYRSFLPYRSPFHPKAVVTGGVLADECAALMQNFFKSKR